MSSLLAQLPDGERLIRNAIADGLRPPPLITVAEWAERHRWLSGESASEPGPYRLDRTPYLREPMEAMSPSHPCRYVTVPKGAQVGWTEAMNNMVGAIMHRYPGPIIYVMPDLELCQTTSKERIDPMIEQCPELLESVGRPKERDKKNSILHKSFPGGFLRFVGANSPARFRSVPARYVLQDELDAYRERLGNEGDPEKLAERAARTFGHRAKIVAGSTPLVHSTSRVLRRFRKSDRSQYEVPCPRCGFHQPLNYQGIRFDSSASGELEFKDTVHYVCSECAFEIDEAKHKTAMLAAGVWVPEAPEVSNFHRGFLIPAFLSPVGWRSWRDIAWDHYDASKRRDNQSLQVVVNQDFAEGWRDMGEAPDWEELYRRREDYPMQVLPEGAHLLTAGVDFQGNRVEMEVTGWGPGWESWVVDYVVIEGDPIKDPTVWEELRTALGRGYPRADGGPNAQITRAALDSGGVPGTTNLVYDFCRRHKGLAMAIKGDPRLGTVLGMAKPVEVRLGGKRAGQRYARGVNLWLIGVDVAKSVLYSYLRQKPPLDEGDRVPVGFCHFPGLNREYFQGITAEERIEESDKHGRVRYVWSCPPGRRNEPLDCRVYSMAAAYALGMDRWTEVDWLRLRGMVGKPKDTKKPTDQPGAGSGAGAEDYYSGLPPI